MSLTGPGGDGSGGVKADPDSLGFYRDPRLSAPDAALCAPRWKWLGYAALPERGREPGAAQTGRANFAPGLAGRGLGCGLGGARRIGSRRGLEGPRPNPTRDLPVGWPSRFGCFGGAGGRDRRDYPAPLLQKRILGSLPLLRLYWKFPIVEKTFPPRNLKEAVKPSLE